MIVPVSRRLIMHSCHWPVVIDTNALSVFYTHHLHSCHWPFPKEGWLSLSREASSCIRVIDQWSMTRMHWVYFTLSNLHSCHWPICIRVIDHSLRRDDCPCLETHHHAFVSMTSGQWHECTECDLHPASASVSLTNVHSCHWPFPKEGWFSLSQDALSYIRVIDQSGQ